MAATSWYSSSDFVIRHPSSDQGRARIANLAATEDATPARIIKTYVTKTEGYKKEFLTAARVAGFRPGEPLCSERAGQRMVSELGGPPTVITAAAGFYTSTQFGCSSRKTIRRFERLLAYVRRPDGSVVVADMLKTLSANAPEYGVSSEQVLTVYDVWGVPRISNFETLLSQQLKVHESKVERCQVTSLLSDVAALSGRVEKVETN